MYAIITALFWFAGAWWLDDVYFVLFYDDQQELELEYKEIKRYI